VWMRIEHLAAACRERLMQAASVDEHAAVLKGIHLLGNPCRRAALEGMATPTSKRGEATGRSHWSVEGRVLAELPTEVRRFVPAWVDVLPMPRDVRRMGLDFVGDPSAAVRHAAVRTLAKDSIEEDAGSGEAGAERGAKTGASPVADYGFDVDARVAASAVVADACLRRPLGSAWAGARNGPSAEIKRWHLLCRSTHASVRRVSLAVMDRCEGTDAESAGGVLLRRRLLRHDPARVLTELKAGLRAQDVDERLRAIRSCVRLGVVPDLEGEFVRLLWSASTSSGTSTQWNRADAAESSASETGVDAVHRVAATAAMAMGAVDSASSEAALRACLSHADARLRSNAIEALAKRSRRRSAQSGLSRFAGVLSELKDDAQHRVRASAAWMLVMDGVLANESKGLAMCRVGAATAVAMIHDPRAAHVRAGLWLVERVVAQGVPAKWDRLGSSLEKLAVHEDEGTRVRAARCIERIKVRREGEADFSLRGNHEMSEAAA